MLAAFVAQYRAEISDESAVEGGGGGPKSRLTLLAHFIIYSLMKPTIHDSNFVLLLTRKFTKKERVSFNRLIK